MHRKLALIHGLWLSAIAIVFASFLSVANASTFFPDPEVDLDAVPEKVDFSEYIFSDDDDMFFIDDMAFRKSDYQRSGFTGRRWTDGKVYYVFDSGLTEQQKNSWLNAAAEWSAVAALSFLPRTTQSNYIYVKKDTGNWSYVGMIGGKQEMGIASWGSKFTIAHEIGHALGMIHEHQRTGRDTFVTIHTANIQSGYEHNFTAYSSTNYGDYDFDSIMHYDKCAFSKDCPTGSTCNCSRLTISCKPPNESWTNRIGQSNHLSDLDKSGMAARYGSSGNTPTPTIPPTKTPVPTQTPVPTHTPIPTNSPIPTSTPAPPATNTPIPTHTPHGTQTVMPTNTPTTQPTKTPTPGPTQTPPPQPTPTPTLTNTPTAKPDDTFTPAPTATPEPPITPTPTPTEPSCADMGVRIDMPTHMFQVNDPCYLHIWTCNPSDEPMTDTALFVILDAYGELYFSPSWNQSLDFYYLTVVPGESLLVAIPEFIWPEINGNASGLVFYAAITDSAITKIWGDYDWWEFGWE
ncbi:MAG: M12 family metallopeptidase [bacterium]